MAKKYDHNTIRVLGEFEKIQLNPGMYIGSTEDATHLLIESFDNSIDEALAGYADIVAVMIDTKTKTYSVIDNGRGIPHDNNTIFTVATTLHSGGKFDKGEEGTYKIATGKHGVGIVALTALCSMLNINVHRDGKYAKYEWNKCELKHKSIRAYKDDIPFSTKIEFTPDPMYFESTDINIDYIRQRMKIASVHIPKLQLVLVIDGKREKINCDIKRFFKEDVLKNEKDLMSPIHDIEFKNKDERIFIRWAYAPAAGLTSKTFGSVNLLNVNQGTHITMVQEIFKNIVYEYAKKEKIELNKNDALVGLKCFISMMLYNPAYTSQTKDKFFAPKIPDGLKKEDMTREQEKVGVSVKKLFKDAEKQLRDQFEQNEDMRNHLLNYFHNYRKKLDHKTIVKSGTTISRSSNVIDSKLKDCRSNSVEKTELFIVEGQSASGTLKQCRNNDYHAILELKGKILNVVGSKKDLLKNNEVMDIINACGTGIEPHFDLSGIRYGKIIIATDADPDGGHISALLLTLYLKLMPNLIKNGHLYVVQLPLYGANVKKKFHPLHTESQYNKFIKKYPKIHPTRFKGLGEMNPDQLEACLLDTNSRKLIQVPLPEDHNDVFKLMSDPNEKRRLVT